MPASQRTRLICLSAVTGSICLGLMVPVSFYGVYVWPLSLSSSAAVPAGGIALLVCGAGLIVYVATSASLLFAVRGWRVACCVLCACHALFWLLTWAWFGPGPILSGLEGG